jgi:hypothetical protein
MLSKKNKTVTSTTKVAARDANEARAKAKQIFWQRGYQGVESLLALPV